MTDQEGGACTSIDEVIDRLDEILRWAVAENSRIGYFSALYRGITDRIRQDIAEGRFEDGPRMELFDVTFANRYLEALEKYRSGEDPSRSWLFAFESAGGTRPVILQHLLLGINAHINLDLGIAAAEISKGSDLDALKGDFYAINETLAERVEEVQDQLARVSPLIFLLKHVDPNADRAIINFSITRARDQAWTVAELLTCLPPPRWESRIDVLDRSTVSLGRLIREPPGQILNGGLAMIQLSESHDVSHVIDVLT
jgi:hypothetical protein